MEVLVNTLFTPPADIAERPVQVRRLYEVGLGVKLLWGEFRIPATVIEYSTINDHALL